MSCGYTGRHFGASYPDAVCYEGYLWDLDSGDGDTLTHGGEMPCPACNLEDWIAFVLQSYFEDYQDKIAPYLLFNSHLAFLLTLHRPDVVGQAMVGCVLPHFPDPTRMDLVYDTDLSWPWPLDNLDLSAHDLMSLLAPAKVCPSFTLTDGLWLRPTRAE
jgi:hypothetical protein